MNTLSNIEELIAQNKILEHRNEELKKIIEVNLSSQSSNDEYLSSFNDIIDISETETLLIKFYQFNKIPTALFDRQGKLIFSIGWRPLCNQFHRGHSEALLQCDESIKIVNSRLSGKSCYLYQCKNGINSMAFSIEAGQKHVATIVLSQYLYKGEMPDYAYFKQQATDLKFDATAYISAINELPTFTSVEIESIIQNASFLAEMISYLGNKNADFNIRTRKRTSDKLLLSSLRDKIHEEEDIIKALLEKMTRHQREIQENMVSKAHFMRQLQQLNDKLESTENILNSLLSSLPLGIGLVRRDVFTYVNEQIAKLTGYTSKELIGRTPELLFKHPADYYKIYDKIGTSRDTLSVETCIKRKDDTFTDVIVFVALINKANPDQGIAFSLLDIATVQEYRRDFMVVKKNR